MGATPPPLNHPQEATCHTHTLPPIHQNALAPTPQPQKQPLEVDFKPPKIEICTKVHNALTRANNRFPHIPKHPKTTPPRTHPAPPPKTPKNSQTHPKTTHPSTQNTTTDPKTAPNPPQKQPIEVDFQPPKQPPTPKNTKRTDKGKHYPPPHTETPQNPPHHEHTEKKTKNKGEKEKRDTPPREQRDPHHTRHPRPPPRRLPLPTHPYTYRLYPHRPTTIRIPVHHYVTRLVSAPTVPLACYCI